MTSEMKKNNLEQRQISCSITNSRQHVKTQSNSNVFSVQLSHCHPLLTSGIVCHSPERVLNRMQRNKPNLRSGTAVADCSLGTGYIIQELMYRATVLPNHTDRNTDPNGSRLFLHFFLLQT